jgi:hypothetical protein
MEEDKEKMENDKEETLTSDSDGNNMMIYLSAVVILAVVGGFFFFARSGRVQNLITNQGVGQTEGPTSTMPETLDDNAVIIANQEPGDTVLVNIVVITQPGYVVIHEDDGGAPGTIIGVSDLVTEYAQNIEIDLDRSSVDGEVLYAMLHFDDDNDGEFTFPENDLPVKNDQGNIVMTPFFIGVSETDAAEDEPALMMGESEDASQ